MQRHRSARQQLRRPECTTVSAAAPRLLQASLVERVTYHNAENGFCVLRARARGLIEIVYAQPAIVSSLPNRPLTRRGMR